MDFFNPLRTRRFFHSRPLRPIRPNRSFAGMKGRKKKFPLGRPVLGRFRPIVLIKGLSGLFMQALANSAADTGMELFIEFIQAFASVQSLRAVVSEYYLQQILYYLLLHYSGYCYFDLETNFIQYFYCLPLLCMLQLRFFQWITALSNM